MAGSERADDIAFSTYADSLSPLVWGKVEGPARMEKLSTAQYIAKMHHIAKKIAPCVRCAKPSCRPCQQYGHYYPAKIHNTKTKWKSISRSHPTPIAPPTSNIRPESPNPSMLKVEEEKIADIFRSTNAPLLGGVIPLTNSRQTQTPFTLDLRQSQTPRHRSTLLSLSSAFPAQEHQPSPNKQWQLLSWPSPEEFSRSLWENDRFSGAYTVNRPNPFDQFQNSSAWPVHIDEEGNRIFFPVEQPNEIRRVNFD